MGSVCEFKLYLPNEAEPEPAFSKLESEVLRFENKYTRFKPDSITSTINRAAGSSKKTRVDEETAQLLNYADVLHKQSEGLFDITSGILRQVWDFKSNTLPTESQLEKILGLISWNKIEWDGSSILLPLKGMEIDFGGYVKEYAADVCATLCNELNIQHGLINLGGDIRIIGPHPDGQSWKVGIQHPRKPNSAIATININKGAIATSGDYERFMLVDGTRYWHILNPKTGRSIQPHFAGISIVAEQCLIAGSFSTLAMLLSCDTPEWVETCGLPWMAIDQEMKIHGTVDLV